MSEEVAEVIEEEIIEDVVEEVADAPDEYEIEVTIGDESLSSEEDKEKEEAPAWVKELRKTNREQSRKLKEYEQREAQQSAPKVETVGARPKLEDYDYDEEKHAEATELWFEQKQKVNAQAENQKQLEKQQNDAWQGKLDGYDKAKKELKVKNYEDFESVVQNTLDVIQQGIILQGAENPALLVYAIGKDPKRAEALAKIKDPTQFAFAVAKLEKDVKVNKRTMPAPERTVSGTASGNAMDSTLEKLYAEADKTGDRSKIAAYKRKQKQG